MAEASEAEPQPLGFLLLYALAAAGGAVAYVPFLTLILPGRISGLAGENAIAVLASIAFVGALAASAANILFGWLSDRTGNRRGWILAGLALSSAMLVLIERTEDITRLTIMIVAWQGALNMMLGPLGAWAGDCIPDRQKGLLGGLLSFAPACGALSGALVTLPALGAGEFRLAMVAGLVVLMVLPVLLAGRDRVRPSLMVRAPALPPASVPALSVPLRMWLARLLVQVAEAALFAYLLLWFRSLDQDFAEHDTARIFSFVLLLSVPLTLFLGRWSDRRSLPLVPLIACAGAAAAGLLAMAAAPSVGPAIGAYVGFGLAASAFLALHSAQTLRVLPNPATRGRDLGIFNLTNTVPSLVMPALTLALVPRFGFPPLFLVLSLLALMACVLLARMPQEQ